MMPVYRMLFDLFDWDTFRLILPQDVFDTTRYIIDLGGLSVSTPTIRWWSE
jgi:hypothetical protein